MQNFSEENVQCLIYILAPDMKQVKPAVGKTSLEQIKMFMCEVSVCENIPVWCPDHRKIGYPHAKQGVSKRTVWIFKMPHESTGVLFVTTTTGIINELCGRHGIQHSIQTQPGNISLPTQLGETQAMWWQSAKQTKSLPWRRNWNCSRMESNQEVSLDLRKIRQWRG